MGATHHLVLNVRFRESKSTVKVKSVLKPMGSFSMYVCVKVMSGHCFGEERKDSTAFTAGVASLGKVSFRIPWGLSLCTFV